MKKEHQSVDVDGDAETSRVGGSWEQVNKINSSGIILLLNVSLKAFIIRS